MGLFPSFGCAKEMSSCRWNQHLRLLILSPLPQRSLTVSTECLIANCFTSDHLLTLQWSLWLYICLVNYCLPLHFPLVRKAGHERLGKKAYTSVTLAFHATNYQTRMTSYGLAVLS